jgi:LuxR family maltose regulon positive regulatory protein
MMPRGGAAARADARLATEGLPRDSWFRQHAGLASALVAVCDGDLASAGRHASEAAAAAEAVKAHPGQLAALGIAAAAAMEGGQTERAASLLHRGLEAMRQAGLEHYSIGAVLIATAARRRSSVGDHAGARTFLARFDRLRPYLGTAFPAFTVLAQLQAMRARLQGDDLAGARILLDEAGAVARARPDLGWLADAVRQVHETVDRARFHRNESYGLTAAELRVLSLLPTHLSVREMAERLHLSPHTVKTQVVALYGKLAATSRLEAIEMGIEAGLLDASVLYRPAVLEPREAGTAT